MDYVIVESSLIRHNLPSFLTKDLNNNLLPLLQHGKELLPVNKTVPVLVLFGDHDLDLLLRPRVAHHHHNTHQLLSVNKTRNKCCILTTHHSYIYYGVLTDWTVGILGKRTDVDM